MIKWIGGKQDPEIEREVIDLRLKMDELASEQKSLDNAIASLNK